MAAIHLQFDKDWFLSFFSATWAVCKVVDSSRKFVSFPNCYYNRKIVYIGKWKKYALGKKQINYYSEFDI